MFPSFGAAVIIQAADEIGTAHFPGRVDRAAVLLGPATGFGAGISTCVPSNEACAIVSLSVNQAVVSAVPDWTLSTVVQGQAGLQSFCSEESQSTFSFRLAASGSGATSFKLSPAVKYQVGSDSDDDNDDDGSAVRTNLPPMLGASFLPTCLSCRRAAMQVVSRGGLDVYIDGILQSSSQLNQMIVQTLDNTPGAVQVGQSAAFPCAPECSLLVALPGNIAPDSVFCVDHNGDESSSAITTTTTGGDVARIVIQGSDGCDCIVGSAARDIIYGLDGSDYIVGLAGRDTVYGVGSTLDVDGLG